MYNYFVIIIISSSSGKISITVIICGGFMAYVQFLRNSGFFSKPFSWII